eukprot:TRINITY_DN67639_c0_g1_i1.p1 TRINITY_DN67639_c0_g1~~TRINITY_DN67639_c0_g1_i1.p1  ORF type:complete len:608 (-),score=93.88 TRINITY_DN67639_c0_g1_i1:57-1880(-)
MDLHLVTVAIQAVALNVRSGELLAATDNETVAALESLLSRVEAVLPAMSAMADGLVCDDSVKMLVESTQALASLCLSVSVASVDDAAETPGAIIAELVAHALAALVLSHGDHTADAYKGPPLDVLELLAADLDVFASIFFGALCRLDTEKCHFDASTLRLQNAVRSVCAWVLAALGRAVGYRRFSSAVLWEWASGDAVWAISLSKSVLSLPPAPALADVGALPVDVTTPLEVSTLQMSVLDSVLGLAAPAVPFSFGASAFESEGDVPIAERNSSLTRHRTELAVAAAQCRLPRMLVRAVTRLNGDDKSRQIVQFLSNLLQPEVWRDPDWATTHSTQTDVASARQATDLLSSSLLRERDALWQLVTDVPTRYGGKLPVGFLRDCVVLAFYCPPSTASLNDLMKKCLASTILVEGEDKTAIDDAQVLGQLCLVASNAGAGKEMVPCLHSSFTSLNPYGQEAVCDSWKTWMGPVRIDQLTLWAQAVLHSGRADALPSLATPSPWEAMMTASQPRCLLRHLVREAPKEFCCQLDGQIMMDPVCSPRGFVCERAAFAEALQESGGHCPFTEDLLSLNDCVRLPELRRRIAHWVRTRARPERTKPRLRSVFAT